jgi:putative endonuclease
MDYYVYIIKSEVDQSYYKGSSLNPLVRLAQHNHGENQSTRAGCPWKLVYLEMFSTKREALIREKALKKWSRHQIETLIRSEKNLLMKP